MEAVKTIEPERRQAYYAELRDDFNNYMSQFNDLRTVGPAPCAIFTWLQLNGLYVKLKFDVDAVPYEERYRQVRDLEGGWTDEERDEYRDKDFGELVWCEKGNEGLLMFSDMKEGYRLPEILDCDCELREFLKWWDAMEIAYTL